jgi:membrane-bound lytic murein transglycosylase C
MRFRQLAQAIVLIAAAGLIVSCATGQIVGKNIKAVAGGGSVDTTGLDEAMRADRDAMKKQLLVLQKQFAVALEALRSNVQKRWGQGDTKTADKTTYVKYTQGYKSRVVTDFNHGVLTVETVDQADPQASLKRAIVSALLTSNDPGSVDLFTDKDVSIDSTQRPYLYGLVHDNQNKSITTRAQAERFAAFLLAQKLQTRTVTGDKGPQTARFVTVHMVRNFEDKGEERYRASVDKYATKYNVSPTLVLAIMRTESNFNPFAVSGAPAYGLMQLVPTSGGRDAYKKVTGIDEVPPPEYLYDPEHSIELGAAYLGELGSSDFKSVSNQDSRDLCVIAAYNTGAGNVTRTFNKDSKTAAIADINAMDSQALYERLRTGLPFEETRLYVVKVTGYRKQFASLPAPTTALQ